MLLKTMLFRVNIYFENVVFSY